MEILKLIAAAGTVISGIGIALFLTGAIGVWGANFGVSFVLSAAVLVATALSQKARA